MADQEPKVLNPVLKEMADVLVGATTRMLRVRGSINLSSKPEMKEKKIVQFSHRMRIDGLEKFSERTVFSVVSFYRDKSLMETHDAVGSLVVYIPVSYISRLLNLLEYPRIEEDDEESVLDGCGTVTNLIAGYFVKDLSGLGYVHVEMSHFQSYINTAVDGIEFSSDQEYKYEVNLPIGGSKKMVLELTMAPIPRY